jgi:hypothetical protein
MLVVGTIARIHLVDPTRARRRLFGWPRKARLYGAKLTSGHGPFQCRPRQESRVGSFWRSMRTFENSDKLDILVTLVEKYEETRWPIQSPANADRHCKILDRAFQARR